MSPAPLPNGRPQREWELTLFVAGDSPASHRARARLAEILHAMDLRLIPNVVDVLLAPQEAMQRRIFVTPALVLRRGGRSHTLIGDLARGEDLMSLLRDGG